MGPIKQEAIRAGRTMYKSTVQLATLTPNSTNLRVLKSSKSNTKLSNGKNHRISKGPSFFRDKPLYSLTLEERKTCPKTCLQWDNCYGNRMPFAKRYKATVQLESAIKADLEYLNERHPEGIVVRLHVLGDFYSVTYVDLWRAMLEKYPNLGLYGYTHRTHGSDIGDEVARMVADFSGRVSILRSDRTDPNDPLPGAYTVALDDDRIEKGDILVCPEQMGKTPSCLTCGLCFNGRTEIHFLRH